MWPLSSTNRPYLKADRLADVIALIQILALHGYRHRTEGGISKDAAQPGPRSAKEWKDIAQEHPEFFRVDAEEKFGVSLISRHVLPKDKDENRNLPEGFVDLLIQTAITLHDRQLERARFWKLFVPPLITALLVGGFTLAGVYLKAWLETCKP